MRAPMPERRIRKRLIPSLTFPLQMAVLQSKNILNMTMTN